MTWKPVRVKGDIPLGCTAHAAVAISDTQFCMQGGMTPNGALDTTFVFDTGKLYPKLSILCLT